VKRLLVSAALAAVTVATVLSPTVARADAGLNATANGRAEAAAVFIPFRVNPNLELYPAYSLSEVANSASQSASHGISAGFYPGFLLDAFMDFYGFKGPGRALVGMTETQWPDPPQKGDASTADFGTLCKESGNDEKITQYFPKPLFDGCQQFYAAFTGGFGGSLPYRFSSGHSESRHLAASGNADGFQMTVPLPDALTIAHARATSDTNATSGHATVADATAVLRDVSFGELHISEIRASARAVDDGRLGPKTTRSIQIVGATLAGQTVTIDEKGISPVNDNPGVRQALDRFAAEGFDVQLVQGHDEVDPDSGEVTTVSGGLQLRMIRNGTPAEFQEPADQLCDQTTQLQSDSVLQPGSLDTLNYDLESVPPLNDAYQKAWDENYPLGLVLPRDVSGSEPVPPFIPCAGVLFDRAVDAGIVLGVATASARFEEGVALPDLNGVLTPGIPDRFLTTTTTIPGTPGVTVSPPGSVSQQPAALASAPGLGADVAERVKLIYGALMILLAALVCGRIAFKRLVRT
jgi:hypothetical protein